jgi:hypothetical protein
MSAKSRERFAYRYSVPVLSAFDPERQIGSDGATSLDRRLVPPDASDLASAGFG